MLQLKIKNIDANNKSTTKTLTVGNEATNADLKALSGAYSTLTTAVSTQKWKVETTELTD